MHIKYHKKVSMGGKLVRDLISGEEYRHVNIMDVATGGLFTRQDPATREQSCLSFVICSADLKPLIESMVINSERKHGIKRTGYKNGQFRYK